MQGKQEEGTPLDDGFLPLEIPQLALAESTRLWMFWTSTKRQEVETALANAIAEGLTGLGCTCLNTCFQGKHNTKIAFVLLKQSMATSAAPEFLILTYSPSLIGISD